MASGARSGYWWDCSNSQGMVTVDIIALDFRTAEDIVDSIVGHAYWLPGVDDLVAGSESEERCGKLKAEVRMRLQLMPTDLANRLRKSHDATWQINSTVPVEVDCFHAVCSCGYQGDWRSSTVLAQEDALAHIREEKSLRVEHLLSPRSAFIQAPRADYSPGAHRTSWERAWPHAIFKAVCLCGWVGENRTTQAEADTDSMTHLLNHRHAPLL